LFNLRDQLQRYRDDPEIIAAATHYELAFQAFDQLRTTLRLTTAGDSPMHHQYELDAQDWNQVREALNLLGEEHRQRIDGNSNPLERGISETVLTHIEKYSEQLLPTDGSHDPVRTTNRLESHWSASKRACRQTQGRGKLTRTFNALPAELMLIPNLGNPTYVATVLDDSLEHLAQKFADADVGGTSYATWRKTNTSLNLGRISSRILRQPDFIDNVIEIYTDQCQKKSKVAQNST